MNNNYYVRNKETGKLYLYFEKDDYMNLTEEQKKKIKSNFLFGRKCGAWVSRAKFPNLYSAEKVAQELGLENMGVEGENLSFGEKEERKAEKAARRADRMEMKANKAEERGKQLQKPIDDMHGDIAFFTQPNISTTSGRAFTRRREKMFESWEKGFEEFKKSEYYKECAERARATARNEKTKDKAFCQRRVDEAEANIRKLNRSITAYKIYRERGYKNVYGEVLNKESVDRNIERWEEIMENEISKAVYYRECIEDCGGIKFSKENIKAGYIIKVKKWRGAENCEVLSVGTKNIKLKGGWECTYAEVLEIVDTKLADENAIRHPFKVGERYTTEIYNYETKRIENVLVEITKVMPNKVSVKVGDGRAKTYQVRTSWSNDNEYYIPIKGAHKWICKKID